MEMERRGEREQRGAGDSFNYLRAPAFKSLGSQREGRYRRTLGIERGLANTTAAPNTMMGSSGNLRMPSIECQLAAKYVTSKPIDLPAVPAKTEIDSDTNRILENMELEKQTVEEDYCSQFEDQVYSISLVEVWMKGYENDVKKLKELGFPDDLISLAFAALPMLSTQNPRSGNVESLSTFCSNFNQMKGMGFSQAAIFGSLIKHKNNLNDAITNCVD